VKNHPVFTMTARHVRPGQTITVDGMGPVVVGPAIFPNELPLNPPELVRMAKGIIPRQGPFAVVVSGFTPAALAILEAAVSNEPRPITFLHWNADTGTYVPQTLLSACYHG
jgi:hypothetical protein